ncbi:L,D-transpeptidase [Labrys monachus]|uniref:Lipoprotein-anchoring transpeptidase ErfK/SrfK n=1 Tax=Labrys monachus TaxID=217067 RepID=A0ABU0F9M5_9HYPH|nr:L,D-transpeptidase [Labrys monachus]MDQ0391313.1 lipoprotein-anchoring transpeptidase ErfK/SrfK [Labrys monachus]
MHVHPRPAPAARFLAALLLPVGLAACVSTAGTAMQPAATDAAALPGIDARHYGPVTGEPFAVPAVAPGDLKPRYMRQLVDDPTGRAPGTIVVDPQNRFLYLVQQGGKALRYGVGVGRQGMAWSGTAEVSYKRAWPRWTPTRDMVAREPDKYRRWADGMDGGERNPLGARALYLFEGGKDTLYRIHGTNEPWSIGHAMSSGCIRMMNQDVIDLYRRVPDGAKVVVLPAGQGYGA